MSELSQKQIQEATDKIRELGWTQDACGPASIIYAPNGVQLSLRNFIVNDNDRGMVVVCDTCYKASCWHGVFMCQDSDISGIVNVPRGLLRALDLEHESYFSDEELLKHTGSLPSGEDKT